MLNFLQTPHHFAVSSDVALNYLVFCHCFQVKIQTLHIISMNLNDILILFLISSHIFWIPWTFPESVRLLFNMCSLSALNIVPSPSLDYLIQLYWFFALCIYDYVHFFHWGIVICLLLCFSYHIIRSSRRRIVKLLYWKLYISRFSSQVLDNFFL